MAGGIACHQVLVHQVSAAIVIVTVVLVHEDAVVTFAIAEGLDFLHGPTILVSQGVVGFLGDGGEVAAIFIEGIHIGRILEGIQHACLDGHHIGLFPCTISELHVAALIGQGIVLSLSLDSLVGVGDGACGVAGLLSIGQGLVLSRGDGGATIVGDVAGNLNIQTLLLSSQLTIVSHGELVSFCSGVGQRVELRVHRLVSGGQVGAGQAVVCGAIDDVPVDVEAGLVLRRAGSLVSGREGVVLAHRHGLAVLPVGYGFGKLVGVDDGLVSAEVTLHREGSDTVVLHFHSTGVLGVTDVEVHIGHSLYLLVVGDEHAFHRFRANHNLLDSVAPGGSLLRLQVLLLCKRKSGIDVYHINHIQRSAGVVVLHLTIGQRVVQLGHLSAGSQNSTFCSLGPAAVGVLHPQGLAGSNGVLGAHGVQVAVETGLGLSLVAFRAGSIGAEAVQTIGLDGGGSGSTAAGVGHLGKYHMRVNRTNRYKVILISHRCNGGSQSIAVGIHRLEVQRTTVQAQHHAVVHHGGLQRGIHHFHSHRAGGLRILVQVGQRGSAVAGVGHADGSTIGHVHVIQLADAAGGELGGAVDVGGVEVGTAQNGHRAGVGDVKVLNESPAAHFHIGGVDVDIGKVPVNRSTIFGVVILIIARVRPDSLCINDRTCNIQCTSSGTVASLHSAQIGSSLVTVRILGINVGQVHRAVAIQLNAPTHLHISILDVDGITRHGRITVGPHIASNVKGSIMCLAAIDIDKSLILEIKIAARLHVHVLKQVAL